MSTTVSAAAVSPVSPAARPASGPGRGPAATCHPAPVPATPEPGRPTPEAGRPLITALTFGSLGLPFAIILVRLVGGQSPRLSSRRSGPGRPAHPGGPPLAPGRGALRPLRLEPPGARYYYLLATVYRIFGGGAGRRLLRRHLINSGRPGAWSGSVRRRGGPAGSVDGAAGGCPRDPPVGQPPGALTYSEGALGAGVSPWTATVIIVPLLLLPSSAPPPSPRRRCRSSGPSWSGPSWSRPISRPPPWSASSCPGLGRRSPWFVFVRRHRPGWPIAADVGDGGPGGGRPGR